MESLNFMKILNLSESLCGDAERSGVRNSQTSFYADRLERLPEEGLQGAGGCRSQSPERAENTVHPGAWRSQWHPQRAGSQAMCGRVQGTEARWRWSQGPGSGQGARASQD